MYIDVKYEIKNKVEYDKIDKRLRKNLMRVMRIFGRRAERRARSIVRSGKFAKNSPPWKAAKGSSKPLYHTGHLSTSIKNKVEVGTGDSFISIKVGVIYNTPHPDERSGKGIQDIVKFLITDRSWKPTDAARRAFWARVPSDFKGKKVTGKKEIWTSPARDFIDKIYKDEKIKKIFREKLSLAIKRTMSKKS